MSSDFFTTLKQYILHKTVKKVQEDDKMKGKRDRARG